ncbi:YkvS family protein [Neobacillus cucumis]|uniref:YkvS family protein n=1 Tax=Neobacillus cucumis TaxID=1740721 RepID=UPI002155D0AF|nr:YkvS family protein [Neobacillus cucumis]
MFLKKAMVGDNIVSINGIKGKVEKVGENSVVIEILENFSGKYFENNRTIVSHKNYVVL